MRKTKGEARRLPRGVKLLSIAAALVLTCVLAVSLIGTSFAADTTKIKAWTPIEGIELSVTVPTAELNSTGTEDKRSRWNSTGTAEGSDFTLTGMVASALNTNTQGYDAVTRTLKISNTTSSNITLKFQWSSDHMYLAGTITCSSADALGTSVFNGVIPANGSVDLIITSGKGEVQGVEKGKFPYQSITLSNFSVVQSDAYTLNLLPAENGTYSATNGTDTVSSSAGNQTITYDPKTQQITLQAPAADSGYKFYLWEDEYHTPLSTKESYTYRPAKGDSVRAVFVEDSLVANYISKSGEEYYYYYYWEDAMRAANAATGEGKYIITDNAAHSVTLLDNAASASRFGVGTYVKQESDGLHYVIPSGVTLVVPYSNEYSTATDDALNTSGGSKFGVAKGSNATGTAYATLTVPQGVVLDVNSGSTLLVNAVQGSTNGAAYHSHVLGNYGKMVVGGKVNMYGTFYARGYVIDEHHTATLDSGERTGLIYAHPGAKVYQMLQITDWRGGDYTLGIQGTVMPITMYYLQNIMVETTYQMGSSMSAQVVGAAKLGTYRQEKATVSLITNGDSKSLFVMKQAGTQFTTRYDYQKDQLQVSLTNGTVEMNFLELKVGSSLSVDTSTKQLAISDNMPITVKRGSTLTINNGLKLLPGASLTVEEGANLHISGGSNAALYFYAKQDYAKEFSNNKFRTRLGAEKIVDGKVQTNNGAGSTIEPSGDAQLKLAGTLTVDGVLSFSPNHQGATPIGAAAKAVINKLPSSSEKIINETYKTIGIGSSAPKYLNNNNAWKIDHPFLSTAYYVQNSAWKDPSGPMVNDGAVTAFEKATYKAAPAGNGTYNWTRYTLNVNYVDAANKPVTGLTPEKLYSIDGMASFQAPDGYAITGIKADANNSGLLIENVTTVDDGKTKLANAVEDGCTDVNLSNIKADGNITVTVKQYDHTVRWNFANIAENDKITGVFLSYLAGGETEATRTAAKGAVIDSNSVAVKKANGSEFPSTTSSVTGEDPRVVRVTGITENAVVTVRYSASRSVTWSVTVNGGTAATTTVKLTDSSEATYTLDQNGSVWQTVALEGGVTGGEGTGIAVKGRTDVTDAITVTNVYSDVTVNIAITTYAHKVSGTITTVNGDATTNQSITPFFTNDTVYTPEPEGSGKYIVSQYRIDGGTLADKAIQSVSTILPADAKVALTGKEVNIKLTFQSYVAVWQWNAKLDGGPAPEKFSYTEYLTDTPNGETYEYYYETNQCYKTVRSNGEVGWCFYQKEAWGTSTLGAAYTTMEGIKCVLSSSQDRPNISISGEWACEVVDGVWGIFADNAFQSIPDATVTVNLVPYAYDVTFTDAKGAVLEKFCATEDGTNAANGEAIKFCVEGGMRRFVKAYEITTDKGTPAINGVTGLKQDKVAITLDPWDDDVGVYGCTLTAVEADTTVKLTLDSYERIAVWQWTIGNTTEQQITFLQSHQENTAVSCYQVETSPFTKWTGWAYKTSSEGRTGYCPQFTIPDNAQYYIANANQGGKVSTNAKNCESEPETRDNFRVTPYAFTLVPYDASLTWSVDGGEKQYMYINNTNASLNYNAANYNAANKTWTYYPADGKLIKSFEPTSCTVNPAADKLSLAVTNLQADSTVSIVTQMPATALEGYYMGDMSFEWVRNAAVYTFDADGKTASWKPVDSFAWRHAAGSRSFTVTEDDTITVANGSIYFINSTSAAKTYTIKLERTDAAAGSTLKLVVDGREFAAVGDTVTIPAHTSQTVVCTLSGTPTESELAAGEIGHITVTESNG